jgi:radical SAM superfamily enzyme YgiQ (UPF0313 family)
MGPTLIFIGHLTYENADSESQCLPLNIGYLKEYALKKLGDRVKIELFMNVDKLISNFDIAQPAIVALSYYNWNSSLSDNVFKLLKIKNNNVITIGGGPNYPSCSQEKHLFWKSRNDFLDFYIVGEGEETFVELVSEIIRAAPPSESFEIPGLEFKRKSNGQIVQSKLRKRLTDLDNELPSPITSGTLDEFVQTKPMIQGVRGCPYSCAYCSMGNKDYNLVTQFSYDRIVSEFEYIKKHNKTYHYINITDDNFGIFKRDLELMDHFHQSYVQSGWPVMIQLATPKTISPQFIQKAVKLSDMINIAIHFQSFNDETLRFIKRKNPPPEEILKLKNSKETGPCFQSANTALIIPMPHETYESFLHALKAIIDDYKIDQCALHTIQLLEGTVFERTEIQKQFDMKIKYRIQAGYFGVFDHFESVEMDKVCVGTNTFTENEYYKARMFYAFCLVFCFKHNFLHIRKFIETNGASVFKWLLALYAQRTSAPPVVSILFDKYESMTKNELFDSKEDLLAFWKSNKERCLKGEFGYNVSAMLIGDMQSCYSELLDFAKEVTKPFLKNENVVFTTEVDNIFKLMKSIRLLELDSNSINEDIIDEYDFDFKKWELEEFAKPLATYRMANKVRIRSCFSAEQKSDLIHFMRPYIDHKEIGRNLFFHRLNPSKYNRSINTV